MGRKLYPVGIQNFEKIRRDGYCYIDKTAKIYELVKTGSYYFLSRPRRFGKSLLVSTLEAYFQGKKELFKGLAMEGLEKEWKQYPILHLDLRLWMQNWILPLRNGKACTVPTPTKNPLRQDSRGRSSVRRPKPGKG